VSESLRVTGDHGRTFPARGRRAGMVARVPGRIRSEGSVGAVAADWDDLVDRLGAPPWSRPGWVAAWLASFGKRKPEILTLRRGDRVEGLVSVQERYGVVQGIPGTHTPGFFLLGGDSSARAELAGALLSRRPRLLVFRCLPQTAGGLDELRQAAQSHGYVCRLRPTLRSPFVATDGRWQDFERSLNKKKLSELRRRRRRLEERGEVVLDVHDGTSRLPELLTEGWEVEAAGWKGERGTAVNSRPETRAFFDRIAKFGVDKGLLRLAFLRLNGHPLAFDFCLEEAGVHYSLKTGYDPAYREFGPGMLMRYEMLARAFGSEIRRYEFLGSDPAWKYEWTKDIRQSYTVEMAPRSLSGTLTMRFLDAARSLTT
jgi:CelD/BcsL family acetyltransferase involved in cellulose biosynthesis